MMRAEGSLLLVDDDEVLRSRLARAFVARGLRVLQAACVREAIEHLQTEQPDRAVVDLRMPGDSGLQLLHALRSRSPATRAIVLTGYGSIANAVEAIRAGAMNYLTKPVDADQILAAFAPAAAAPVADAAADYQPFSLAEVEWHHIHRVLADCDGNLSQAANLLGIPRRTLQRKLKKNAP